MHVPVCVCVCVCMCVVCVSLSLLRHPRPIALQKFSKVSTLVRITIQSHSRESTFENVCRCLSAAEGGQAFAARVLLREKNEDKKIEPLFGGGSEGGEAFAARVVVCHFPKKPGALLRTQINHDKFDGHLRAHGVCTTAKKTNLSDAVRPQVSYVYNHFC